MSHGSHTRIELAAWVLTACLLLLVVKLQLVAALFAGLLVHELINLLASRLKIGRMHAGSRKLVAVALLAAVIVALLSFSIFFTLAFFRSGSESLPKLVKMMAEILEGSREQLPTALIHYLPADLSELKIGTAEWLRQHATDLRLAGEAVARKLAHILVGMVIGALISLREALPDHRLGPLGVALEERADHFATAFRRIVFAQVRVASLNTFLTWLYLGVALPLLNLPLPYVKTLVAVTFVCGLLPVIGNLISNAAIVIVSLSVSLHLAAASLIFLVLIHKLEYFVNARIVGSHINAKAWELLLAMLVMEAAFGLVGLVAAPIYYAFIKEELRSHQLI